MVQQQQVMLLFYCFHYMRDSNVSIDKKNNCMKFNIQDFYDEKLCWCYFSVHSFRGDAPAVIFMTYIIDIFKHLYQIELKEAFYSRLVILKIIVLLALILFQEVLLYCTSWGNHYCAISISIVQKYINCTYNVAIR